MSFTPGRVTTGSFVVVALFRFHNTGIALGQTGKTGVAEALVKAFAGFTATMLTVDLAGVFKTDRLTNQRSHIHQLIIQRQLVVHGSLQLRHHLAQVTTGP